MWLDEAAIWDLELGAALLGSGGGGDAYLGALLATHAVRRHGPVLLVAPYELPDEALVVPVAFMGAPTVAEEKVPGLDTLAGVLAAMAGALGRPIDAVLPMEVGGRNCLYAMASAAAAGLPLVDADGFGRAFPELQMLSFAIYGVNPSPFVMMNERGDELIIRALDHAGLEHLARGVTHRFGGLAHVAGYAMTGAQLKESAVLFSVSTARRIGAGLRAAGDRLEDVVAALGGITANSTYGAARLLGQGQVAAVERAPGTSAHGALAVRCRDGRLIQVHYQYEFLLAESEGRLLAAVPDLIVLVDAETLRPLLVGEAGYGQPVAVISIPAPEIMRSPAALRVVGPRCFGYDLDGLPVDETGARG